MTKAMKSAAVLGTAFLMAVPAAAPIHLNITGTSDGSPFHEGTATWYGIEFHGRETASGEVYDMYNLTAAHRELPLGSRVRVINLENQKWVIVRINDRGPADSSSMVDLSLGAAEKLAMRSRGRVRVKLEPVLQVAAYTKN